jgi:hypothetical protein
LDISEAPTDFHRSVVNAIEKVPLSNVQTEHFRSNG